MHVEPPRVIAVVSPHGYRRLEAASSPRSFLLERLTVQAACTAIRGGRRDPVVLDASGLSRHDFDGVLGAIVATGSNVIFHGPRDPIALDRALECALSMTVETVIWDVDNEPGVLRALVAGVREPTVQARVLRAIAPKLAALPIGMRREFTAAFLWNRPRCTADLVRSVGISRRTVERQLADVGLMSTAVILRIAALSKSWLGDAENESAHDKALRCGFQTVRTMQRCFRLTVGGTPQRALRSVTAADAALALTASICT